MPRSDKPRVLYVDDEELNLTSFQAAFRRYFHILTAPNAEVARKILSENEIHVLITDHRMPTEPGMVLLSKAVQHSPNVTRILLSGFDDEDIAISQAVREGLIYSYVKKPWDFEELKAIIEAAFETHLARIAEEGELNRKRDELKRKEDELNKLLDEDAEI